ncbi:hypothetical protein BX265_8327 [Streptomyces sp. TLI_235]|nr:hypothetical protein [Streptomyces sp. TLI_235]PBC66268.1 hypothetical protein BX265_8327 [Streptomyces sp. TLI_235]
MADESDRLPARAGRPELPDLPAKWQSAPLNPAALTDPEYAFVAWLRRVLKAAADSPSQTNAAERMGIDPALLSRLLKADRVSEAVVLRVCDGIDRAWGRTAPAVTAEQRREGLKRANDVLASRSKPNRELEARRKAEDARQELEQATLVQARLETRLASAEDKVRSLERTLAGLEGDLALSVVDEVEILAEAQAGLATTRSELAAAQEQVRLLESDLESARIEYKLAKAGYELREAELERAAQEEAQERLQVQDQLSGTRAQLATAHEEAEAARRKAEEKIRKLERQIEALREERLEVLLPGHALSASGALLLNAAPHTHGMAPSPTLSSRVPQRPAIAPLPYLPPSDVLPPQRSTAAANKTAGTTREPSAWAYPPPLTIPSYGEQPAPRPDPPDRQTYWKQFVWGSKAFQPRLALAIWVLTQLFTCSVVSGLMQLLDRESQRKNQYAAVTAAVLFYVTYVAHSFFMRETKWDEFKGVAHILLGLATMTLIAVAISYPHAIPAVATLEHLLQ